MIRLPTLLIAAALASTSAGALAASEGVDAVREQAKDTYNMDRKNCAGRDGEERKDCLHRARAQYNQAIAEVRRMERAEKREKAAARAEKRKARGREDVASGGERSRPDDVMHKSMEPPALR